MTKLHPIEKLSRIQYDVIMQAINNAKAEIKDDEFIDPYAEVEYEGYNNINLFEALVEVEYIILSSNIPN